MADRHYLNVTYSVDESNGHYSLVVQPGDAPGMTDILYKDLNKEVARVSLTNEQFPLFMEALQRRYEDAKREEREAMNP